MLIWMLMFVGLAVLALVAFLAIRSRPGRSLGDELGEETRP
jgi:hypothetical protein